MNWLDIVILVLIAVPTFIGLRQGLIKAILSLAGLIIGVILAGSFHGALAGQLTFITQESLARIVAFVIILIGVMIIAGVIASILKSIASLLLLGWVNKLGGAAFGFLMGAIFCGTLLIAWAKYLGVGATFSNSILAALLIDRVPVVLALLPDEFGSIRSFFQ